MGFDQIWADRFDFFRCRRRDLVLKFAQTFQNGNSRTRTEEERYFPRYTCAFIG